MNSFEWVLPAEVLEISDGDTYTVRVDLGWKISLETAVRLAHCDTPEKDTEAGRAALAWISDRMPVGTRVIIRSHRREKFGRILASVKLPDGTDLTEDLIAAGHAQPYEGGRKP